MIQKIKNFLNGGTASSKEIQLAVCGKPSAQVQITLNGMVVMGQLEIVATKYGFHYSLPGWSAKPFQLVSFLVAEPVVPKYDLEAAILAVIGRDAPTTAKILNRVTCYLHLRPFDISFKELREKLYEMEDAKKVFFLSPTETTDGGWYTAVKPKEKKHGHSRSSERRRTEELLQADAQALDAGTGGDGQEDGQDDGA